MFNDKFRVWFPFTSCDWYVWYRLAGSELVQPHSMKCLRLIGANVAYQKIIAR